MCRKRFAESKQIHSRAACLSERMREIERESEGNADVRMRRANGFIQRPACLSARGREGEKEREGERRERAGERDRESGWNHPQTVCL